MGKYHRWCHAYRAYRAHVRAFEKEACELHPHEHSCLLWSTTFSLIYKPKISLFLFRHAIKHQSGAVEEPPWQEQQQQQQPQQQPQQGNGQQNGAAADPHADTSGGGGGSGDAEGDGGGGLPPLPEECNADKHPVVVLRSVYTREESESDPNFFDDLEVRFSYLVFFFFLPVLG